MDNLFLILIRRILTVLGILFFVVVSLFIYAAANSSAPLKIEVGEICVDMNENYYSGLLTVIVSIVAIALPLSISVITQSKEENFNSKEMADSFYRERRYIAMKRSVVPLVVMVILSYFNKLSLVLVIPTTMQTIYVIYQFYKYMEMIEGYVSDFAGMVISQEKRNIDEIF